MTEAEELGLPPHAFDRQDEGDDLGFYAPPRLVTHIDKGAVVALTDFYRDAIPAGGRVLDLMSSWVSHLPDDVPYAEVVGHGMNEEELAANPRSAWKRRGSARSSRSSSPMVVRAIRSWRSPAAPELSRSGARP